MSLTKKYTLQECSDFAKKIGWACVSQEYINSHTPMNWLCPNNHSVVRTFGKLIKQNKCHLCFDKYLPKNLNYYKAIALESGIKIVDDVYKGSHKEKYNVQCLKCGFEWQVFGNLIQQQTGCPECFNKKRGQSTKITENDYLDLAKTLNITYKGPCPSNVNQKCKWVCFLGHEINKSYSKIKKNKTPCDTCFKLKPKNNSKKDIDWLYTLPPEGGRCNSFIYKTAMDYYEWECQKGHKWKAIATSIARGRWCGDCQSGKQVSKKEQFLFKFVQTWFPGAQNNVIGVLSNKRFELDIFIPELKKAIEFDGVIFHGETSKFKNPKIVVERENRKNQECEDAGIDLYRIKEFDFDTNLDLTLSLLMSWMLH